VAATGIVGPTIFRCPSCGNDPAKPLVTVGPTISSHYVFLHPLSRLASFRSAGTTELAYESLPNHDGRGINVLYVDGHVEWHAGATATATLARLAPATAPAAAPATAPPAAPIEVR
jgi:prepilin-type processing-associated H-X9-DG protein